MNPNGGNGARLNRRRSEERNAQNSSVWAVATPLWTASQPPNASGDEGRYRPSCRAEFLAPSPAEL
jgi:hypothetical protein